MKPKGEIKLNTRAEAFVSDKLIVRTSVGNDSEQYSCKISKFDIANAHTATNKTVTFMNSESTAEDKHRTIEIATVSLRVPFLPKVSVSINNKVPMDTGSSAIIANRNI